MNLDEFIAKFGDERVHQFIITEDVYASFQTCSRDMNPLHVDDDYATRKGFLEKVMYGNILNNFISYFVGMCMPSSDVMLLKQDIIYLKPTYMNDSLNLIVNIVDMHQKFNILEFKFVFKQNDINVARGRFQIKLL